jgi:beta-glucosidase
MRTNLWGRAPLLNGLIGILTWIGSTLPAQAKPISHAQLERRFLMGTGNSAFQVEGSPAPSDWTELARVPGAISDGSNFDLATDFWNRYREDFDLAQSAGLNAFRLSIAWERVEPAPGVFDLQALNHYSQMIHALRERSLEPIITLQHFTLPLWLAKQGGLEAKKFPFYFARYVERVTSTLNRSARAKSERPVTYYLTFNEPEIMVKQGYREGNWPPNKKNDARGAIAAFKNLIQAHHLAAAAIKKLSPQALVGFVKHWTAFEPSAPWSPLDRYAAQRADFGINRSILDAFVSCDLNLSQPFTDGIGTSRQGNPCREAAIPVIRPDWIGMNYYRSIRVWLRPLPFAVGLYDTPGPKTDQDWSVVPTGLRRGLREIYRAYSIPILVTENGVADASDRLRGAAIRDHLEQLRLARVKDGVDVFGYLHWSLTDNFELTDGLSKRFGLVAIDYENDLERTPRPSFYFYAQKVKEFLREFGP